LLVPDKLSLTTTILILVKTGSEFETKENNGISHFLEHMCFKGTKKRPSQLIISTELENIGAKYNAFTSQEYTGYYAKVRNEKFEKALDIIADIYLNPLLDEKEIEKEKGLSLI
ncbi:MAG: insulinase family protein, partial [Patescibacteria group bacterium]|nr:insulinase family protein [Patescibacteria group bacterium]